MFLYKSKIEECKVPRIFDEDIFFVRNDNLYKIDKFLNESLITPIEKDYAYSTFIFENTYFLTSNGTLYTYSPDTSKLTSHKIGGYTMILSIINSNTLIGLKEEETIKFFNYNLNTKTTLWSTNIDYSRIVVKDKWAIKSDIGDAKYLHVYNLENGKLIIELDATQLPSESFVEPRFTDVRIFHNNSLIVSMPDMTLVSFQLDSGKVEWYTKGVNVLVGYHKGRLYNLNTDTFIVVDANTGKIEKEMYVVDEYKMNDIEMGTTNTLLIKDSHAFFTDNWKSKVAALNIHNGKIEWVHDVKTPSNVTLPNPPIIKNNKLYLQDSENTLHIFEKE